MVVIDIIKKKKRGGKCLWNCKIRFSTIPSLLKLLPNFIRYLIKRMGKRESNSKIGKSRARWTHGSVRHFGTQHQCDFIKKGKRKTENHIKSPRVWDWRGKKSFPKLNWKRPHCIVHEHRNNEVAIDQHCMAYGNVIKIGRKKKKKHKTSLKKSCVLCRFDGIIVNLNDTHNTDKPATKQTNEQAEKKRTDN